MLWYLEQLAPGQPTFNVTAALRITGPLDQSALERSVNDLVARHESLRTTFSTTAGTPYQQIAPELPMSLESVDLTELPQEDREREAKRRAIDEARRPFDLINGPLVRVCLIRLGDEEHAVLLTMHHLVTDGWSLGVAGEELIALYETHRQARPSPATIPLIQYADYALWQRNRFQADAWTTQIERMRQRLAGVPALELPTDRPRPPVRTARGAQHPLVLSPELSEAVRGLSRREGVTPFMTLLAAFKVLLGRWSGQDDFAVGSPAANRTSAETERLIGYFVNMLPLRADLSGNPTVRELLFRVREVAVEAFESQAIPLEILIAALNPPRDASRSPLFQVMFILQNNRMPTVRPVDLVLSPLDLEQGTGTSKFDLALGFEDTPTAFAGSVEFSTDLFEPSTIERFCERYCQLLEAMVADPEQRLAELPLLSEVERQRVVAWSIGSPIVSDPREIFRSLARSGIHERFEAQVQETPDRLAVVGGTSDVTYIQLNRRANQLARHLRSRGVRAEDRVGLILGEPLNRIVGVLGVLKAGGAYVPLDPEMPAARLKEMLDAAGVSTVIIDRGGRGCAELASATRIDLEDDLSSIAGHSSENPAVQVDGEHLAYVVFTSGTTGQPKGVMITHRGLLSVAAAWEESYALRQTPLRHLQVAGFAFDVFAGDWVRALTTGGTLVACPRNAALDPRALAALIDRERIECLELVPAVAELLAAHVEQSGGDLSGLRLLAVGSDTLRRGLYNRLRRLLGPTGRVVNSYGLTEVTIDSAYFEGPVDGSIEDGAVPIGRPLPGTQIYVLDRRSELVPTGVVGELYIGGPGVARVM